MATCPKCGMDILSTGAYCVNCGAPLNTQQNQLEGPSSDGPTPYRPPQSDGPDFRPPEFSTPSHQTVEPYPTGGLMAWSIITLLLCTIAGIVAIIQTTGINKCATVEEQKKKISSAKTWCIIGTVVGIFALIGNIATRV